MKRSTVIGMVAGGLLAISGGILAYLRRNDLKEFSNQVVDEVKKRLKKDETSSEDLPTEQASEE